MRIAGLAVATVGAVILATIFSIPGDQNASAVVGGLMIGLGFNLFLFGED